MLRRTEPRPRARGLIPRHTARLEGQTRARAAGDDAEGYKGHNGRCCAEPVAYGLRHVVQAGAHPAVCVESGRE